MIYYKSDGPKENETIGKDHTNGGTDSNYIFDENGKHVRNVNLTRVSEEELREEFSDKKSNIIEDVVYEGAISFADVLANAVAEGIVEIAKIGIEAGYEYVLKPVYNKTIKPMAKKAFISIKAKFTKNPSTALIDDSVLNKEKSNHQTKQLNLSHTISEKEYQMKVIELYRCLGKIKEIVNDISTARIEYEDGTFIDSGALVEIASSPQMIEYVNNIFSNNMIGYSKQIDDFSKILNKKLVVDNKYSPFTQNDVIKAFEKV